MFDESLVNIGKNYSGVWITFNFIYYAYILGSTNISYLTFNFLNLESLYVNMLQIPKTLMNEFIDNLLSIFFLFIVYNLPS